ncbi:unnamed protein product [Polarella glacialis]|uniref:Uncharacterized protein n=1 Tax=Polarella glacialis TaxID=89957 RepID=A0A813HB40_POLGL|nr:unnamed protein product [Polarella glacialis]
MSVLNWRRDTLNHQQTCRWINGGIARGFFQQVSVASWYAVVHSLWFLAQSVGSLQCAQLPWQLESLNVNSRHYHAIQTIASKWNNLVTFPAGTNDTEADQRGAS